jgi:drug/metabolite transporter (DMT)-like permease
VVFGGTFVAYILMMIGQKALRPTVVSMYNYMQPIAGTAVSIALGMATFGVMKGIAVVLVFVGVYFVTQSKSREQVLAEKAEKK